MNPTAIDYSIVIPVYYNEGSLVPLAESLRTLVFEKNPNHAGEIIFVDDGSGDASLEELQKIQGEHPSMVTIIKLSRNFGQGMALLAGYNHAKGKCVISMSADGQEPPEVINDMLKGFFQEGYEIVICTRTSRNESVYRKMTSQLYYFLLRQLAFKDMPKGGFDFYLLGRRAMDVFIRNIDPHPSYPGLILWMGFKKKVIAYHRRERLTGVSRYRFARKVTAVLDGIMGYSFAPIRVMSLAGCVFSLLGFAYAGLILVDGLMLGNPVKGWAPLMIVVLVIGGFQMIMLGIIGEYLWRTLAQARRRDLYLIEAIYERQSTRTREVT